LGARQLRLLSNTTVKRVGLKAFGLEIVESIPLTKASAELEHPWEDGKWLN
jgi:GTP cyclohydrolase II